MASEGEVGRKWDRCLADSVVKLGEKALLNPTAKSEPYLVSSFPLWPIRCPQDIPNRDQKATVLPGLSLRCWFWAGYRLLSYLL
ncbi:MICOS complex subunit MIC10 isoform X1 [Tiliqua scincoides]|uniref:MICOS complex subunit MIC10 isoform X1 n=1 Tax=Tiliqua scincoides TaxID=71010 RepID=UPI003462DA89